MKRNLMLLPLTVKKAKNYPIQPNMSQSEKTVVIVPIPGSKNRYNGSLRSLGVGNFKSEYTIESKHKL